MSKKTEQDPQELHVEAELALFAERGVRYICRGAQEQDVGKVVARIEGAAKAAARGAERKARDAATAKAVGDEAAAARHEQNAAVQKSTAEQLDALSAALLEIAGEVKARLGEEPVETRHVTAALLHAGRKPEAAAIDRHARVTCGADLGRVIAELPRPCDSEPYVCPSCGRVGHASKTAVAAEAAAE